MLWVKVIVVSWGVSIVGERVLLFVVLIVVLFVVREGGESSCGCGFVGLCSDGFQVGFSLVC